MLADRQGKKTLDWLLLAGYAVVVFCLLPVRPLWLDELMEVVGSAGLSLGQVVTGYAAHSAGQSPLAACEQALAMRMFGFSTFAVRIPAAIAALLAGAGMLLLGRRLELKHSWLPFAIAASFPIVLRYGAEDRPYSQALCIAVWLSVVFVALLRRVAAGLYAVYAVLLVIGLYTQPYIAFVALSHGVYLLVRRRWRMLVPFVAMIVIATLLYLPWYLYARAFWRQEVEESQLHFHPRVKLALLIPRELTGAGYVGTAVLIGLAVYGFRWWKRGRQDGLLWCLAAVLPVCFVVLADWIFDYFFAIRQVIVVLPALAVLSAAGLERTHEEKSGRAAMAVALSVLLIDAGYAIRWFSKPGEDWSAAAVKLRRYAASGACLIVLPSGTGAYYAFFEPDLKGEECGSTLDERAAAAVAISPYLIDRGSETETVRQLQTAGFVLQHSDPGQPELRLYVRGRRPSRMGFVPRIRESRR